MRKLLVIMAALLTCYLTANAGDFAEDRLIVQIKSGHQIEHISSSIRETITEDSFRLVPFYRHKIKSPTIRAAVENLYVIEYDSDVDVEKLCSMLNKIPEIDFVEPYIIPKPFYEPNDPFYPDQWHIPHIKTDLAWDIIRGDSTRNAIIGIVDTGVYYDHPDLEPNMWINELEDINGNGRFDNFPEDQGGDLNNYDDDGNGYADDVVGYDLGVGDPDPSEESPEHGTAVAGCASEATDNSEGGAGVGFSARILAGKGSNRNGSLTAVYQAMVYAADNGANIINCSWGSGYYNQAHANIVRSVIEDSVLVVAAGGSGTSYPCAYDGVLCVGSVDHNDFIFDGWDMDSIDIYSPGTNILSTWSHDDYITYQGTSIATPVVSGAAALLRAYRPELAPEDISEILIENSDLIDSLNPGYENLRRINIYNALISTEIDNEAQIPPDTPLLLGNYPNPFNSSTTISYYVPMRSDVTLKVYNIKGQLVDVLINNIQSRGNHSVQWNATDMTSGIYFYRLTTVEKSFTKRMTLLK